MVVRDILEVMWSPLGWIGVQRGDNQELTADLGWLAERGQAR